MNLYSTYLIDWVFILTHIKSLYLKDLKMYKVKI